MCILTYVYMHRHMVPCVCESMITYAHSCTTNALHVCACLHMCAHTDTHVPCSISLANGRDMPGPVLDSHLLSADLDSDTNKLEHCRSNKRHVGEDRKTGTASEEREQKGELYPL